MREGEARKMDERLILELVILVRETTALVRSMEERQKSMFRLQAMAALQGKPQREQIERLHDFGFQPRDIAQVVGTTSNSVRVALVRLRKSRKKSHTG